MISKGRISRIPRLWQLGRGCRHTDAGPAFYLEHLKRLKKNGIQPYFPLAHVHQLEIVERLIRHGAYMGPLNMAIATHAVEGAAAIILSIG